MRPLLLLMGLLFSEFLFSQSSLDTTIQKRQLDSIEYVVYRLKDSLRRIQYENTVLLKYYLIDTSTYGKDSVIIKYKSKNGKLLKVYTKKDLQTDGLYNYEKIEYLNNNEQPEFVEHWEQARSFNEANQSMYTWKVYSYERFEYDQFGRVLIWLKFRPEISRRKVQRYDYTYLSDGKKSYSSNKVDIGKFWDN